MPKTVFGEKKKPEYDKTGRKASRERRSRKRQQVQPGTMADEIDKAQQYQYEYIQKMEVLERFLMTENETLKSHNNMLSEDNENLKMKNKKLKTQILLISKQTYRWLQQKDAISAKYQRMRVLHTAQVNVKTLLQAAEVAEDQ